ncbi:HAD family phosphatase [Candidatus Woesearchaeota archaeon]|nr:HAD family phosphatase [Candidatus Woesearchaeota archaeon]
MNMREIEKKLMFMFDVDGVLVETPHEESWKDAAVSWKIIPSSYDFSEFYAANVAGEPGLLGAHNILEKLMGREGERGYFREHRIYKNRDKMMLARKFRETKQDIFDTYIEKGKFKVIDEISRFVFELYDRNIPRAVVSSSENAAKILSRIDAKALADRIGHDGITSIGKYSDLFNTHALGMLSHWNNPKTQKRDHYAMARGMLMNSVGWKPEDGVPVTVVFEDAPKGIKAVKPLGFYTIGVTLDSGSGKPVEFQRQQMKAGANLLLTNQTLKTWTYDELIKDLERIYKRN